MKRPHKITLADWLAIGGIALTTLIFVAQEGLPRFNDPQQLAKYKLLLGAIVLIVMLFLLCRYIWHLMRRFIDYRNDYNLADATMLSSMLITEILNRAGDLQVDNSERLH